MRPNFGYIYQFLFVHQAAFAKLPPDVQQVMVDEAIAMEVPGMRAMNDVQMKEDEDLKKLGVVHTQLNPAKAAEAVQAFNDGIWETATTSKATGDRAKEFQAFMKAKGFVK